MCGIAGYLSFKNPASPTTLLCMLQAIGHRGPDGFSGSVADGVALGTARLAIVDIEGGVQPVLSDDRKVIAIFNGEIFNYLDLRHELNSQGVTFHSKSEIETILKLYLFYGRDFVKKIKGQFAIAIWDGRDRTLNLFRDRFGIRPLFWYKGSDVIVFGSEIKALFASGFVPASLNLDAILQTFHFWTVAGETTAFEGVLQVPPGHMAVCGQHGVKIEQYWSWSTPKEDEMLRLGSDEAYFEAFNHEMRLCVDRQRMSDVPVGSYLSGGIDSSVLAAILQQLDNGKSLRTYSISFQDPEYDESSAQSLMAQHFGFAHATVHIKSADIGANFPQVVWQAETPLFRTAAVPLFLLSRMVHDEGRKLVMTGEGADEILLGYDLFREVSIRRFWARQSDSEWRGKLFQRLYSYLPQYRNPRYLGMVLESYRATLIAPDDPHYAMAVRWQNGQKLSEYFSPALQERAKAYNPLSEFEPWLPHCYSSSDDIERAQMVELSTLLGNYLLSSQGDRMTMAHGVEGRYPYLDEGFVEFANRLPRSIKLRGLKDKFILRQSFSNMLPNKIANRPKVAYQSPDLKGFFINGQCPDYVEALMSRKCIEETGLFNASRVEQLVQKGRSFNLVRAGMRDNMAFTLILSTQLLNEIFVRGNMVFKSDIKIPSKLELI